MKKLVLLSMVLVLCLATVGVGYAKWKDGQLEVEGKVCTSVLKVCWYDLDVVMLDPCGNAEVVTKEIVDCDTVKICVKNADPGVKLIISLIARNEGTIPANVYDPCISSCPGLKVSKIFFFKWFCKNAEQPDPEPCIESNPLTIYPEWSIKPLKHNAVWLTLWAEVEDCAPMGECLEFSVKLDYKQICKPC